MSFPSASRIAVCWCLLVVPSGASQDRFDPTRDKIRKAIRELKTSSLAVAVAKDGEILWNEAFGWADRERRIPATPHTMYSLASVSKPITATALMRLVERGLVDLNRPINDYFGPAKLTGYVGDVSDATVRLVAAHQAGLPLHYQFFLENEDFPRPSMEETIRRYGILVTKPGERYQYSNLGYGLLEYVIEKVSGKSYSQYMKEDVFIPLDLEHMAVPLSSSERAPAGTHWAVRYWDAKTPLPFYDFDHRGASAVFACALDLVRFGMFHHGDIDNSFLERRSQRTMQRPIAKRPGGAYGLGWGISDHRGYRMISHTGGMGGVRTSLRLIPSEKLVIVALANTGVNLPLEVSDDICAALLPDLARSIKQGSANERPRAESRRRLRQALQGVWEGAVRTHQGEIGLTLWLGREESFARIGQQQRVPLVDVDFDQGYLTAKFDGDIGTDDANRREYFLALRLKLRGDVLNGAITATGRPGPKLPNALTSWAELRRRDSK